MQQPNLEPHSIFCMTLLPDCWEDSKNIILWYVIHPFVKVIQYIFYHNLCKEKDRKVVQFDSLRK